MKYDKIVRDRIPDLILSKGDTCKTWTCSETEAIEYLITKITEEAEEFRKSKDKNELADILEVLMYLSSKTGTLWTEVEELRRAKWIDRGGFSRNVILLESSPYT